jgi:hypothetical protein
MLMPPRAFTTRCQGTCSGQTRIAQPTVRAERARDLAVGDHASARHAPYERVHAGEERRICSG